VTAMLQLEKWKL